MIKKFCAKLIMEKAFNNGIFPVFLFKEIAYKAILLISEPMVLKTAYIHEQYKYATKEATLQYPPSYKLKIIRIFNTDEAVLNSDCTVLCSDARQHTGRIYSCAGKAIS